MKKFWAILLFIMLSMLFLFGCVGPSSDNPPNGGGDDDPPDEQPYTLRPGPVEIDKYSIVHSASAPDVAVFAASELQEYVKKATGKMLPVKTDEAAEADNEILIGKTNRSQTDNINYTALGKEGFTLRVDGNKFLIAADERYGAYSRGLLYGVYTYLELLGYRFLTTSVEVIPPEENVFIPEILDDTQIPAFSFRDASYYCSLYQQNSLWSAKQKINSYFTRNLSAYGGASTFAYPGGSHAAGLVHTMFHLVPESLLSTNPNMFALYQGQRRAGEFYQICYTNEAAYQQTLASAKEWLNVRPEAEFISISINDAYNFCECNYCAASDEQYGITGTVLRFTNRLAQELKNGDYSAKVIFLAYAGTNPLPKGGIVPADNVVVQLAAAGCQYHTLCDETLTGYDRQTGSGYGTVLKNEIEGWSAIAKAGLMIYTYPYNYYRKSVAPLANYSTIFGMTKLFLENGVVGIYSEGPGNGPSGEFGELKTYLLAKIQWNPHMTETEFYRHMDEFLEGYYGSSWTYIREYIDLTVEKSRNAHVGPSSDLVYFFDCSGDFAANMAFINQANELWDQAEYNCFNPAAYAHIERSRIQLRFYELYTTMEKRWKDGDAEARNQLVSANQKMYGLMRQYDTLNMAGTWRMDVNNNEYQRTYSFEKSPNWFILTKEGLTQFIGHPY